MTYSTKYYRCKFVIYFTENRIHTEYGSVKPFFKKDVRLIRNGPDKFVIYFTNYGVRSRTHENFLTVDIGAGNHRDRPPLPSERDQGLNMVPSTRFCGAHSMQTPDPVPYLSASATQPMPSASSLAGVGTPCTGSHPIFS